MEDDVGQRASERDPALDAFGNELFRARLEVSVLAARVHRAERTHASVHLEAPALEDLDVARGLLRAREQTADHARARAGSQRLDDVARELDAAVRDDALAQLVRRLGAIHDRGDLRHADACDDTGRADGTGSDTDLDDVRAVVEQRLGALCGRDVADDVGDAGICRFDLGDGVEHALGVTVSGVDDDDVDFGFDERGNAVEHVGGDADSRSCEQSAVFVLRAVGILDRLLDVLDRDESFEIEVLVDEGQLLDAMLAEDLLRLLERGADGRGDEVVLCHALADRLGHVRLEPEVAVGDDADQLASLGHGHAADAELAHQVLRVREGMLGAEMEGIGDDAVLAALDLVDLLRLVFDRHVFVDDADAAFACDRDRELILGDRVHRCAEQRNVEFDLVCEVRRKIDLVRQHFRIGRDEQYVVESKSFFYDFCHGDLLALFLIL